MMSKRMEDLVEMYSRLAEPCGSGDLYAARAIPGRPCYRVAKDSQGNPALLVAAQTLSDDALVAPLELPNLSFRLRRACRVQMDGTTESIETLAVLKCSTEDLMLREYFLHSAGGLVAALPETPTEADFADAVNKLVELFRALETPPRKSLRGIWCELFLIARAANIRQAARAWHSNVHALHDFSAGRQRVEVKSCAGPIRNHHFHLDQLLPQQETDVLIVSFILEESGRGTSITELWDEISRRHEITVRLQQRLFHILSLGLGRDWRKARRVAFDTNAASNELRLYSATAIPRVNPALPVEVSEVHFRSELTEVVPLSRSEVARRGGLFAAMFGPGN